MLRSPASSRSPAVSRLRLRPSRRAREMELKVTTLEGKEAGSVQLSDAIFGLEPRADIIQRCVQWQLNKRQAGTHKAQGRADVWRTGKKMYRSEERRVGKEWRTRWTPAHYKRKSSNYTQQTRQ